MVEVSGPAMAEVTRPLSCAEIYEEHFDFVWRNARRLGVNESGCEDVVHEVFVVVQRRLGEFEGRSSVRTWLYGILVRVVQAHRREIQQRLAKESIAASDQRELSDDGAAEDLARKEATALVDGIVAEMDDEKRAVFVLVDLEETSVPDAARGLGVNLNTAYARLRAARLQFADAVKRIHARSAHTEATFWWRGT